MGTLINALAIIVATLLGIMFKKRLSETIQQAIMFVLGLALLALSMGWFLRDFIVINNNTISTQYDLLIIVALVLGTAIGEIIDIDGIVSRFAEGIENKYHLPPLAKGFIAGTLIFCVGAMAILGALQEGITGDYTILVLKSALDFVTAMVLASVLGLGVAFAAISVILYQGSITILATYATQFLTDPMTTSMSLIGSILLMAIAFNFMRITRVKVANMLPSLAIPIVYFLIVSLF